MDFDPVAQCEVACALSDGSVRQVRLRIGKPYQPNGEDWCCPVAADGLRSRPLPPVWGVDSWQSIQLAIRLLAELVQGEVDRGAILRWPLEDSTPVSVAELFGYRPASAT
jgi:Domain of unknown function (DUF6968)